MKEYKIEISKGKPNVNRITIDKGQSYSILLIYKDWTINKSISTFSFKSGDVVQNERLIVKTSKPDVGYYEVLYLMKPVDDNTTLKMYCPVSSIVFPDLTIYVEMNQTSQSCNMYNLGGNYINANIDAPIVSGPTEVNMNSILAAKNKVTYNFGSGAQQPEIKYLNQNGESLMSIKGWTDGPIPGLKKAGFDLSLNPTKLILNGVTIGLKEITVGGETLSVLAAI